MKAITLRNMSPRLARSIRDEAHRRGQSLNRTVISLLERALGVVPDRSRPVHHDLDRFFGTLSAEDADLLMKSVEE